MFFQKEPKQKKPKYKATYKSLHSGNTKVFAVAEPTEALLNFLQKGEDIWEMYMLTSVVPLSEE
jgi:hypothetical protein